MSKESEIMSTRFITVSAAVLVAGCAAVKKPDYDTLIAHRGESHDAPENTLPAYRMAVERGFGFEIDIYLSKDKRLFTFHDRDLTRTTGGACTNLCTEASWEETVSKVNVGGWGKWKGSKYDPTRPALLEDVLELARSGRKIYCEVKGNDPSWAPYIREVFAKCPKANPDTVLFITFGDRICRALKDTMPEYKTFFLIRASRPDAKVGTIPFTADELIEKLRSTKADGLDICYNSEHHTPEFIRKVKDAGYEFHVWTIDDPAKAAEAFSRGVDTVTTNRAKYIYDARNR